MNDWLATAALGRAALVGGVGLAVAVVLGAPVAVVLTVPLTICAALGLWHVPREVPTANVIVERRSLHEGQGTRSRLALGGASDVEHVARVSGQAPYVALHPADGIVGRLRGRPDEHDLEISPRRWGVRRPAEERVAVTTPWAGWRWGPVSLVVPGLEVFPARAPFDSRAELPQPLGLVGAHRSRRVGSGSEFSGIRRFQPGDPVRRVSWRTSLRTGTLHVVSTRAEEDSAVLVFVDALADYGVAGGVDGDASSLDLGVRAAAALSEHFVRTGDRVALKVLEEAAAWVPYGGGTRHQRRILATLARIHPGRPPGLATRLEVGVSAGTTVVVLTPMLDELVIDAVARLAQRGLPVVVVDTLPAAAGGLEPPSSGDRIVDLAWRVRRLEREALIERLGASGCPIVTWRGPGTLDEVLHRLARRPAAAATR